MYEDLFKDYQSAGFVLSDLRSALGQANAVEALVLLELIEAAASLQNRIESLGNAVNENRGG
jgi:hypothetical protein